MVAATPSLMRQETIKARGVAVVDMAEKRAEEKMVRACEELGFFKVINHGLSEKTTKAMEAEAERFFALPSADKERAGPPSPLGYGVRSIGFNGDTGEVEYLILPTNRSAICHRASAISCSRPAKFSRAAGEYIDGVRALAINILEMLGKGLRLSDRSVLADLAAAAESDSLLRLNYYSASSNAKEADAGKEDHRKSNGDEAVIVGFGEHTDPQILTLLRSNEVPGLQVFFPSESGGGGAGMWAPVAPDPSAFFVIVGDLLQVMTNGRLLSARHRAVVSGERARLSTVYFAAPPLQARIAPLPEMILASRPRMYSSFTWGEYKKVMYALRLGHNRLDLFLHGRDDDPDEALPVILKV